MKKLFFILLLLLPFFMQAQDAVDSTRNHKFGFSLKTNFNQADCFTGGDFIYTNFKYQFSVMAEGNFRPFTNRVLEKHSNNIYYQFREKRFMFLLGAEKFLKVAQYKKSWLGPYLNVMGGYLGGDYFGTRRSPENGWVVVPSAGIMASVNNNATFHLGFGYLDTHTSSIPSIRYFFSVNLYP